MVGEFLILIAIVILGGALIKILADMRIRIDHQTKVDEEILEAVAAIRGNIHRMANPPAKFVNMELSLSSIENNVGELVFNQSTTNGAKSAIENLHRDLMAQLETRFPPPDSKWWHEH